VLEGLCGRDAWSCVSRSGAQNESMQRGPARTSLRDLCVASLIQRLHLMSLAEFSSVSWPEECLCLLLAATLASGRLTEHTATLFQSAAPQSPQLQQALAALRLQPLPVLAPTARPWLGQPSNLY